MDVMQRPMTDAQVQYLVQLIDSRRNEAATKGAAPNGGGPGTPATPATPATRPAPVTAAAAPTDMPKKKPPPTYAWLGSVAAPFKKFCVVKCVAMSTRTAHVHLMTR